MCLWSSKQANTAYEPENSKEIQPEVETSSLSDVYPLLNIAGQWHKDFETSSHSLLFWLSQQILLSLVQTLRLHPFLLSICQLMLDSSALMLRILPCPFFCLHQLSTLMLRLLVCHHRLVLENVTHDSKLHHYLLK